MYFVRSKVPDVNGGFKSFDWANVMSTHVKLTNVLTLIRSLPYLRRNDNLHKQLALKTFMSKSLPFYLLMFHDTQVTSDMLLS